MRNSCKLRSQYRLWCIETLFSSHLVAYSLNGITLLLLLGSIQRDAVVGEKRRFAQIYLRLWPVYPPTFSWVGYGWLHTRSTYLYYHFNDYEGQKSIFFANILYPSSMTPIFTFWQSHSIGNSASFQKFCEDGWFIRLETEVLSWPYSLFSLAECFIGFTRPILMALLVSPRVCQQAAWVSQCKPSTAAPGIKSISMQCSNSILQDMRYTETFVRGEPVTTHFLCGLGYFCISLKLHLDCVQMLAKLMAFIWFA